MTEGQNTKSAFGVMDGLLGPLKGIQIAFLGSVDLRCFQISSILFCYGCLLEGSCNCPDRDILVAVQASPVLLQT